MNCLTAVFNYGFAEYEVAGRNPFSRVLIPMEGADKVGRTPFLNNELHDLYELSIASGKRLRLVVPILGETGCRIAEIVGLRRSDVSLDTQSIKIVAHQSRRLKTPGSEREIPLVGFAFEAIKLLMATTDSPYLYSEYLRDGLTLATHAGNTLNKWLKRSCAGKTAHCLRHTFRDRLRAAECPLELLDALGGWSAVQGAGRRYGSGYSLDQKRLWLQRIAVSPLPD
jgi:integrase